MFCYTVSHPSQSNEERTSMVAFLDVVLGEWMLKAPCTFLHEWFYICVIFWKFFMIGVYLGFWKNFGGQKWIFSYEFEEDSCLFQIHCHSKSIVCRCLISLMMINEIGLKGQIISSLFPTWLVEEENNGIPSLLASLVHSQRLMIPLLSNSNIDLIIQSCCHFLKMTWIWWELCGNE